MDKNFVLAIYQTGEVVKLSKAENLPGSDVIAFVHCKFNRRTRSNFYYSYCLFDENLERIHSNCLEYKGNKCFVASQDEYLPPFPTWTSNKEVRVAISIQSPQNEHENINFDHCIHDGRAFKKLLELLNQAECHGLPEAKKQMKRTV